MSAFAVDRTYVETSMGSRAQIHVEAHAQDFSVRAHLDGGVQVVVVCGELDMATAPLLRSVLGTVRDQLPVRVELDLSGVTFLDAYALAALHVVVRSMTAAGRGVTLRDPSPVVRRIIALAGLEGDFDVTVRPSPAPARRAS